MDRNELLTGRVALITGGGGEIGGAIAMRLAAAGAAVAVADLRAEAAKQVADQIADSGGRAIAVQADVAVAADARETVEQVVQSYGKLTTLVNVAANVT